MMIKNCPNCRKKIRKNFFESQKRNTEVWECPKQFGGCGYSNIKAVGNQTNINAFR